MRIVLKVVSLIIVLCTLGLALVLTAVGWEGVRVPLAYWISTQTGRKTTLQGPLDLELSSQPRIRIRGIRLHNLPGSQYTLFAEVDTLEVQIDLWSLLQGRWVLPEVSLTNPVLHLERSPQGVPNWVLGSGKDTPGTIPHHFTINRMIVRNGTVTFFDPRLALSFTAEVAEHPVANNWRVLSLRGSGTMQGGQVGFALQTSSLSTLWEPSRPFSLEGCLNWAGTHSRWAGSIDAPWNLRGFDLAVELSGSNLADLFPITGVMLAGLPPYHLQGHLSQEGENWRVQNLQGSLGDSDFAGEVTLQTTRQRPRWVGHLQSHYLDMKDIGIHPATEPNPSPAPAPVLADADLDLQGQTVVTPIPFHALRTHLHLEDGRLRLEPLLFEWAKGQVNATLGMDTRHQPMPITLESHFQRLDMKHLLASLGFVQENGGILTGEVRFHSDGGRSLVMLLANAEGNAFFVVTEGQMDSLLLALAQLDLTKTLTSLWFLDSRVGLRCAVAGLRAHAGILTLDPFVIDTTSTKVTGGGSIDLREESLDLHFEPHPKDLSLLSAHAPLHITGTFQSHEIRPKAGPLGGRVAAAAALGVLVGPVGAIMPFIEPGIGEDNDCQDWIVRTEGKPPTALPSASQ